MIGSVTLSMHATGTFVTLAETTPCDVVITQVCPVGWAVMPTLNSVPAARAVGNVNVVAPEAGDTEFAALTSSFNPAAFRPEIVPPTAKGPLEAAQATATFVTLAFAVPEPFVTAQVWPVGCVLTVTA